MARPPPQNQNKGSKGQSQLEIGATLQILHMHVSFLGDLHHGGGCFGFIFKPPKRTKGNLSLPEICLLYVLVSFQGSLFSEKSPLAQSRLLKSLRGVKRMGCQPLEDCEVGAEHVDGLARSALGRLALRAAVVLFDSPQRVPAPKRTQPHLARKRRNIASNSRMLFSDSAWILRMISMFSESTVCLSIIGVLFGCFARKIDGDS